MSLLQAYLRNPKTQRVLSRKPGNKGFSLIELVVVVAVLAILSAIAIPSFTSINKKARASAATNTIATVVKDCAVKYANGESSPTFASVSLDGYSDFWSKTAAGTTNTTACLETGFFEAVATDTAVLPTFVYNIGTGAKTCSMTGSPTAAAAAAVGCKDFASGAGVW
ncbi:MAG TPA: hypothetical protein DEB70_06765 [Planctomycetaceae bacterium]|nr:hypothetical protein [Planctomycetaceae bacterium]|tara:strand:- start:276 stop:776 length:501 start_codon:yes stop_codon:yes gene_type:complete